MCVFLHTALEIMKKLFNYLSKEQKIFRKRNFNNFGVNCIQFNTYTLKEKKNTLNKLFVLFDDERDISLVKLFVQYA